MRLALSTSIPLRSLPLAVRRARAAMARRLAFAVTALALGWAVAAPAPPGARDAERVQVMGRLRALAPLLEAASGLDDAGKLLAVNRFFNERIRFRDDIEVWGESDHWASPLELLARGEGDCEDFAIAKYFSLLALGIPRSQLRLVYMQARLAEAPDRSQAHMVLAHFASSDAEPSILDNLANGVLPATRRDDLTPVFSFNAEGMWQGLGTQPAGDPVARLSRWRAVLAQARAEGFS
jgi:predicted transglutaminase-like cysteine proteinase